MEHNLLDENNEKNNEYHYQLEHKNQNLYSIPSFKEWYKNKKEFIKKENDIRNIYDYEDSYFIFSYCPNCISYVICSVKTSYCFIKCMNCKKEFCLGCFRYPLYPYDDTICLKGFLKLLYHRVIDKRSDNANYNPLLYFFHIIVCLFLTPIYLGMISNFLGFMVHKNKKGSFFEKLFNSEFPFLFVALFSLFRGLLMFPYIITFFPFMLILLLPGIFSHEYYFYYYNMYITIFMPGRMKCRK